MPKGVYKHKPRGISPNKGKKFINRKRPIPFSAEHREKIKERMKGNKLTLGFKHTKETKRRMSESHKGEKNYLWIEDRSLLTYPDEWTNDLKDSIRKRDNYTCQMLDCGIHQDELVEKLNVHHIDYNKYNLNPENLISLCRSCHIKTNHNRNYWIKYYGKRGCYEHTEGVSEVI